MKEIQIKKKRKKKKETIDVKCQVRKTMMALLAMAMMTLMLMSRFTVGVVVKGFVMEREELRNVNVGSNVQVERAIVVVLSLDDVIAVAAVDSEEEVTTESLGSDINSFDEKYADSFSNVLEVDSFDGVKSDSFSNVLEVDSFDVYVVSSSDDDEKKKCGSTSGTSMYVAESISEFAIDSFDGGNVKTKSIDSFGSSVGKSIVKEEVVLKFVETEKGEKKMGERNLEQEGRVLEGDSFARSSDRFAQFDDSSVMSEFGIENKNKNSLSQVTEVVI